MGWSIYEALMQNLAGGNMGTYFNILLNDYFPYGLLFWAFGLGLFLILHTKTKNFVFSGGVTSLYFLVISTTGFVSNIYVSVAMRWIGIILGLSVGYYLYKLIKG